ncbi:MAG: hypothetical protein D6737_04465 [Chloroflexi bacterium]|nr:MAG: hypothetical protein D6737_04465 [Chloroflexota bacterium]
MIGAVFTQTLRTKWRQILYWGGGMGLMGLYAAAVVRDSEMLEQYSKIVESMPSFLLDAFGGGDAVFMATPEGFLSVEFFGWALLLFSVYAIIAGLNVVANEEDDGIMDVLLSWPIARWQIVVEKLLAQTVIIIGMLTLSFVGLLIGVNTSPVFDEMSVLTLVEGMVNMLPGTLLVLVLTTMISVIVRRKSLATGLAAAYVAASFFMDSIARAAGVTLLKGINLFSYFNYYEHVEVIQHGLQIDNLVIVLVASVVLMVVALIAFQQRDIGL